MTAITLLTAKTNVLIIIIMVYLTDRVLFQQGVNMRLQCETTIVYLMVRTVYAYKSPHSILHLPSSKGTAG